MTTDTIPEVYVERPGGDFLTVEGVRYAGRFFREMARELPVGVCFEMEKREDGTVSIKAHNRTPKQARLIALQECAMDAIKANNRALANRFLAKIALTEKAQ